MEHKLPKNMKKISDESEPAVTIAQIDKNGLEPYIEQLKDIVYIFVTGDDGNVKAVMVSCEVYEEMQKLLHHDVKSIPDISEKV